MTHSPADFGRLPTEPEFPPELPADASRQAVASIRGVIYQLWWSIDAWLRLTTPNEVIYLEGSEDLDRASAQDAVAQQVKSEVEGISLNNQRALKALENFWTLRCREVGRTVEFHYISTAPSVVERDAAFGGMAGMDAWNIARDSAEMTACIQKYLAPKFSDGSALRAFLTAAGRARVPGAQSWQDWNAREETSPQAVSVHLCRGEIALLRSFLSGTSTDVVGLFRTRVYFAQTQPCYRQRSDDNS